MTPMTRQGEPSVVVPELDSFRVLDVPVSATYMKHALVRIDMLIRTLQPYAAAYVCLRDVNSVIACQKDARLKAIHEQAAMVTPDGMPVVWLGQRSGFTNVDRVYGPDLLLELWLSPRRAATGTISTVAGLASPTCWRPDSRRAFPASRSSARSRHPSDH